MIELVEGFNYPIDPCFATNLSVPCSFVLIQHHLSNFLFHTIKDPYHIAISLKLPFTPSPGYHRQRHLSNGYYVQSSWSSSTLPSKVH